MTNTLRVVRDDVYEEIAMTFQRVQVAELNEALKSSGVSDSTLRKQICSRFSFALGNFFDQYWFEVDGHKYYPLMCFSERFLNTDTPIDELGTVYAPSILFAYHEMAGGDADWYFDDQNEAEDAITMGVVGDE